MEFNGDTTTDVPGVTNVQQLVSLGADFVGTTTMSVNVLLPYIAPADITLNIKNGVTFIYVPQIISPGIPFNIYLQKSIPIIYDWFSIVDVFLTCGDVEIMTWRRVKMNQVSTLSGIPADTPYQSNCLLTTTSDDCYYPASTSVSIVPSPFGSQLYPITPDQQIQFALDLTFHPEIVVNL